MNKIFIIATFQLLFTVTSYIFSRKNVLYFNSYQVVVYRKKTLKNEITDLEKEIESLQAAIAETKAIDVQGVNWGKASESQDEINRLNRSCQRMTQEYSKDLLESMNKMAISNEKRKVAENINMVILNSLKMQNKSLEAKLSHLVNYKRIGSVRDNMMIREIEGMVKILYYMIKNFIKNTPRTQTS